ncbi:agamous-like mads-box protein agl36 [Phtheirospermum japonicum]|uniref:Agamous-like mads-box protein agl36 n=1 Tax=Phtheirospermum japonicum TaxID=374723 RepID=A0A830D9M3_9LAMI|nr:agamous-like mads-box protein agl36 [Phtheirospermum japonicum]
MGRAKLKMELIAKEKSRLTTFKKRKQGLIRKIREFTTLCDVSACMIIYGPNQESGRSEPETWPESRECVNRVIDVYRAKNRESGHRTYGLPDFFLDRKRKVEDDLKRMRKKNMEAKYPTWLEFMNYMPEARLRDFATELSAKAERVRARVEQMRLNEQGLVTMDHMGVMGGYYNNAPHQMQLANYYPTMDNQFQNSSMMMLLTNSEYDYNYYNYNNNNNDCGNFQCGQPAYDQRCVFYDRADPSVMWDGMGQCYRPGPQLMLCGPGPELQFFKTENDEVSGGDQESVNGGQCDQEDCK